MIKSVIIEINFCLNGDKGRLVNYNEETMTFTVLLFINKKMMLIKL